MPKPVVHIKVLRAGLGNLLFPWARAEVFRHQHGLEMLAPRWGKVKIGPLLRGERDLRMYMNLFSSRGYIRGLRRWWWLRTAERFSEADALKALEPSNKRRLIIVADMAGLYDPLVGHESLLARRLYEITTHANREQIDASPAPRIALHVRRGDVKIIEPGRPWEPSIGWLGLPEDWFIRVVGQLRAWAGWDVPVTIFTDAYPNQIPRLSGLPNVSTVPKRPAIVDMLHMAKAKLLVPTTSSTFSMWSAFLSDMPVVWYPGRRLLKNLGAQRDIEASLDGELPAIAQPIVEKLFGKRGEK